MVKYLLDTMVLSEMRRPRPSLEVVAWLRAHPTEDLFLSVATIAEVERGASAQKSRNPPHARALSEWIEQTLVGYADRIIPVDAKIARRWGQLSGELGYENTDLMIAATALDHGLVVATRDRRGFERTGVQLVDPFARAS